MLPKYSNIFPGVDFSEGLAPIKGINKQFGFINKKGKWVILPKFKFVGGFHEGLAAVESSSSKWGFINKKGKITVVLLKKVKFVYRFGDGLAGFESINGKYGFINKKGKVVIPVKINKPFKIQY